MVSLERSFKMTIFFISVVVYEIWRLFNMEIAQLVTSYRIMSIEKFGCKNKKPY